jgi:hypothetical protein
MTLLRAAFPALLAAALLVAPYLDKPFHIDDPIYLRMAEQIRKEPLHPQRFEFCWDNPDSCGSAHRLAPAAPLMGYFLVPAQSIEWRAHALQLAALLAAILATVSFALRLGWEPFWAGAAGMLLVAMPPVVVMTNMAMPEILAMALVVIGLERAHAGGTLSLLVAGVALGLAPWARPNYLLFLPIAFLLARRWLPVLLAAALYLALRALTWESGAAAAIPAYLLRPDGLWRNFRAFAFYWVFPLPLALTWLALEGRKLRWRWLWYVPPAISAVLLAVQGIERRGWALYLAILGFASLAAFAWRQWSDASKRTLTLCLFVPLPALLYAHFPAKYLTAAAPALALLLADEFRKRDAGRWLGVICLTFLAAGSLMLHADAKFATGGKRAVEELALPHLAAGERLWYSGQWGFSWYAERAGARLYRADREGPKPGDLLLLGDHEGSLGVAQRFPKRSLVERRIYFQTGAQSMYRPTRTGLHSNLWGELTLGWGSGPVNRYELWRIE